MDLSCIRLLSKQNAAGVDDAPLDSPSPTEPRGLVRHVAMLIGPIVLVLCQAWPSF